MKKATQFHSPESLKNSARLTPVEIVQFVENFRQFQANAQNARSKSKLISMKVPEPLLAAFKARSSQAGIPYQTQIKKLMREWLSKQ